MPHNTGKPPPADHVAVKSILVVEDDSDIGLFLVQAITQETAHQAMLVANGFEALKAVKSIKPDLFILDYWLPTMNGIELFDRLHAMKELENIPAIMISAQLPKRELAERKIYSMNKPLELDEFLRLIEQLLASKI